MATSDVNTLFRRFGGNSSGYQEIISRDQVTQAEAKWPMLGQIKPTTPHEAPSARRVASTSVRRLQDEDVQSPPAQIPIPARAAGQPVAMHKNEPAQGLSKVFQALAPEPHVPTGPAERVFRQEKSADVSPPPSSGMFAGLVPPTNAAQKLTRPASSGPFADPARFAQVNPQKGAGDSNAETVLGRKLGAQVGGASGLGGASRETRPTAGSINKADGANKSNELQQLFGKMVAQPDPLPLHAKNEGISKRPIKW